jgi:hypothetical protein
MFHQQKMLLYRRRCSLMASFQVQCCLGLALVTLFKLHKDREGATANNTHHSRYHIIQEGVHEQSLCRGLLTSFKEWIVYDSLHKSRRVETGKMHRQSF